MNINFSLLDNGLNVEGFNILVLRDPTVFSNVIRDLYNYDEDCDVKLYTKDYKLLKNSDFEIITDIFGYNVNSPTILKKLYLEIESEIKNNDVIYSKIDFLSTKITDILKAEIIEHEIDLEYDEITIFELIKALGVQIETKSDTILEKTMEIIQVFKYFIRKKLLILVNISGYFREQDIKSLIEYVSLYQMNVLILEQKEVYNYRQFILDEDYFFFNK